MRSTLREFREFAVKGNVIDMAIGIIIGTAFGKIVTSLVSDVLMPPIGLILNNVTFSDLYINLSNTEYSSLAEAQSAGAPTINYGVFLDTAINFLVVSFVVFLLIKQVNRLKQSEEKKDSEAPKTLPCPFCLSSIPSAATRCAHCTATVER